MWSYTFDGASTDASEKVNKVGALLDSSREPELVKNAMMILGFSASKDAMDHLARAAGNGSLDADSRAQAIGTMVRMQDYTDWGAIENLTRDPEPKVAASARAAYYVQKPPATGLLVAALITGEDIQPSDVRVGDIIQKYNGAVITTEGQVRHDSENLCRILIEHVSGKVSLKA